MDGTVFREILRSIQEEAEIDAATWAPFAEQIRGNMLNRTEGFAVEQYPYGSEFAFDTTGQEEVVVWLMHFFDPGSPRTASYGAAAKRTVDHVLSYMRSSPTFAYHGGARSWGDLGNNGKWFVSAGAHFQTRGNFHCKDPACAPPSTLLPRHHRRRRRRHTITTTRRIITSPRCHSPRAVPSTRTLNPHPTLRGAPPARISLARTPTFSCRPVGAQ